MDEHKIYKLNNSLSIFDTLSEIPSEDETEPDIDNIGKFLPSWFNLDDGSIDVANFFYNVAYNQEICFVPSQIANKLLSEYENKDPSFQELETKIKDKYHLETGSGILALNFLLLRKAISLGNESFMNPFNYIIASASAAREIGFETFEKYYDENSSLSEINDENKKKFAQWRTDRAKDKIQDLIDNSELLEKEGLKEQPGGLLYDFVNDHFNRYVLFKFKHLYGNKTLKV